MGSFSEVVQPLVQTIQAARGFDITLVGLLITFVALGTIAISISLLPNLLKVLNKFVPEPVSTPAARPAAPAGVTDDIVAAIGLAFHSLKTSGK